MTLPELPPDRAGVECSLHSRERTLAGGVRSVTPAGGVVDSVSVTLCVKDVVVERWVWGELTDEQ